MSAVDRKTVTTGEDAVLPAGWYWHAFKYGKLSKDDWNAVYVTTDGHVLAYGEYYREKRVSDFPGTRWQAFSKEEMPSEEHVFDKYPTTQMFRQWPIPDASPAIQSMSVLELELTNLSKTVPPEVFKGVADYISGFVLSTLETMKRVENMGRDML